MINRDCLKYLEDWYNKKDARKPLLIRGARQVGKTTLVRMLAKKLNVQLIEINLEKPWRFTSILKSLNPKKIIEAIEFELNIDIDPSESIIFFDEVQAVPDILPLLRYFYEEAPEYRIITTGSLIEFVLAEPKFSIPVGRIELFHLCPLTFKEYLNALEEDKALNIIKNYGLGNKIDIHVHDKLNQLLRVYIIIGGMPEAIDCYVKTQSFKEVEKIKSGIIDTFRLDFNKYHGKANPKLLTIVFDRLPFLAGKKLIYSHIDINYRSNELADAVRQLYLARIISKIFNCHANGTPLAAEKNERFFKLILLDVGLLLTQLKIIPTEIELVKELNHVNNGILAEQFIGQHLQALQPYYSEPEIYYWAREKKASSAEVDFLITDNNNIIPIEVKAGSTGSLRSLQVMAFEKSLQLAVRFNCDLPTIYNEHRKTIKGEVNFKLLSLPHYLIEQVQRLVQDYSNQ